MYIKKIFFFNFFSWEVNAAELIMMTWGVMLSYIEVQDGNSPSGIGASSV